MIYDDSVLAVANELYGKRKLEQRGLDPSLRKPEQWPQIESLQVQCVLEALVEAINAEFRRCEDV